MGLVSGNRLNRFWRKGVKPIKDAIGVLSALSTVEKSTLVAAVNELAEGKFDVAKLIASTNITEPGFAMDGAECSKALTELYSKNGYSFEEICVGTWVDGKPLYRKMVDFGTLPSDETKSVSVGVDNIAHAHVDTGRSFWTYSNQDVTSSTSTFSCVYLSYIAFLAYVGGSVTIKTNNVGASSYRMYVCLEYTKTTD